jgi:hypothetical protein
MDSKPAEPAPPLKACCQAEADRNLRKHRHVARCDKCNRLILGYGNDLDFDRTVEELESNDIEYQTGSTKKLRVVAYQR